MKKKKKNRQGNEKTTEKATTQEKVIAYSSEAKRNGKLGRRDNGR